MIQIEGLDSKGQEYCLVLTDKQYHDRLMSRQEIERLSDCLCALKTYTVAARVTVTGSESRLAVKQAHADQDAAAWKFLQSQKRIVKGTVGASTIVMEALKVQAGYVLYDGGKFTTCRTEDFYLSEDHGLARY